MADAIGNVRATFTASAGGMLGAIDQIVGKLGSFAAATKRTQAQTADYNKIVGDLGSQFLSGGLTADEFANKVGNVQGKFKGIGEVERMRLALQALQLAQATGTRDADELAAAEARLAASVRNATPPIERLMTDLKANREAFLAGKVGADEYKNTIATLPGEINGVETEQQKMERIFKQSQETVRKLRTPLDEYETEMRQLREQLDAGAIDEDQFNAATKRAKETLDKTAPAAKSVGDAFGGLPGPLGAAARAFDTMQKSFGTTIAGFKSGGISGGISSFVGQIRSGIANAGATGGASLVGIAPQIAAIAGVGYAAVQGLKQLTNALGEVGSRVERTGQLASRLGVSFQQYEILATAANMAGVETEALAAAQTKGLKAISAARDGAGEEAKAFEALGISQEMLNSTSPNALLEIAAQRLEEIQDPAAKAALAVKIFGKSGNDVLPALKGIDSVRDGIARLGGVMNDSDKMRFTALDDAFDNAGRATTRLGEVLLTPFTTAFASIAEGVAATFGGIAAALSPVGGVIADVLGVAVGPLQLIGETIGIAGRVVGILVQAFQNGIGAIAEFVSQGTMLAPLFDLASTAANGLYEIFKGIGGWVGWVVKKLEEWVGIKVEPMKAGADAEGIEAQMKAKEDAEKAEKQRAADAEKRAEQIKESLLSPYEQMMKKVVELDDLEKRGLLTAEQRAAAEAKVRDEFAAQDPLMKAMQKAEEDRQKASEEISKEIEKSAKAGQDLGAAADPIRNAFASTAEEIKRQVEAGIISPEDAKKQMAEAVDGMNEELKRLGEDQKFAEKIRDGMKTEIQKVQEELNAIDKNETLTAAEKDKAKAQVRDKFAGGLPGAAQQDAADKFREDQKKLKDALDAGLIDKDQFRERQGRLREELDASVSDLRDKQERNKQPDRRAVGATEVNSSEGASTFFRLLRGQDDPTKKQLDEMRRQTRLLERVADAEAEVVQI